MALSLRSAIQRKAVPFVNQARRRVHNKPFDFKENPIIFNKINETYVIKGKEKMVGIWLLGVSATVFGMIMLGGYTRLSRSGLSMVKWHPHKVSLPASQEEWQKEFEEYQEYPEYYLVNKHRGMDLEGFKRIYFVEWAHRILGRSLGLTFMGPLAYFWYKGYLMPSMKKYMLGMLAFGGLQGVIGWWMVKSGLVDKQKTNEIDKTPRVSPYRLMIHGYSAYIIYGFGMWFAMQVLRRPQEAIINLNNMADHAAFRKITMKTAHMLFPIVLLTGFFTAGTFARYSVNTFPHVGPHWFLKKNHFQSDIPLWKNFTENKIVVQVVHRTLAVLFGLLALKSVNDIWKLQNLSRTSRNAYYLILLAVTMQACIGITSIWWPDDIWIANSHQAGALTVLTAIIYALHTSRKVDPRHIRNLLGKLKVEDPEKYKAYMAGINKKVLSKSEMDAAKKFYEGK